MKPKLILEKIYELAYLFPLSMLFLAVSPLVLGLAVDVTTLNIFNAIILVLWVPVLILPYLVTGSRVLFVIAGVLVLLLGSIETLHWLLLGEPSSRTSIFIALETTLSEASDYLGNRLTPVTSVLFVGYLLLGLLLIVWDSYRHPPGMHSGVVRGGYLALIAFFFVEGAIGGSIARLLPPPIESTVEYTTVIADYRELAASRPKMQSGIDAFVEEMNNKQTYVIVIGESSNRNHMSLYGYQKQTTPHMEARNDLYVFNDVISAYSHTRESLEVTLTFASYSHKEGYGRALSLIDVARAAGFRTYWLSNQASFGIYDNMTTILAKTSHNSLFLNPSRLKVVHDEKLLPPFRQALSDSFEKKLIILHLMGTHMKYRDRYPERFAHYSTASVSDRKRTIAEYDNAILYNDYVVNQIFEEFAQYTEEHDAVGALLYLSDHGEDVFDINDFAGHGWRHINRHQVEIPFVIGLSDAYRIRYPEKTAAIERAVDKPYILRDFIHAQIDLMGIHTPLLNKRKSLFRKEFTVDSRIVYGKDYDREIKQ